MAQVKSRLLRKKWSQIVAIMDQEEAGVEDVKEGVVDQFGLRQGFQSLDLPLALKQAADKGFLLEVFDSYQQCLDVTKSVRRLTF